jgi:hypothetical protein
MMNRFFLMTAVSLDDHCLFLPSPDYFSQHAVAYLIDRLRLKKRKTSFNFLTPTKNVRGMFIEREKRNALLWSGSSELGWKILGPQNFTAL